MRTIRRLYFYAVAFISLEVVLWGLIGLLRSIFVPAVIGGSATRLAEALALILVGMPVFGLHWWVAQRDARREMDEHASGLRAFFLYAVLLSTLIPAIQSFLAVINRLFLEANHLSRLAAVVGSQQTWSDNLIALLMNALIASYFLTVLRADWKQITLKAPFGNRDYLETFTIVRRISRYLWVLYGLFLTVAGVQQILLFILQIPPSTFGSLLRANFINGLALTLVGTPVWVWAWKTVQDSLSPRAPSPVREPGLPRGNRDYPAGTGTIPELAERESLLRLGLLYALSLGGVITVLTSGGIVLDLLLRQILGEKMLLQTFVQHISGPLSIGVPLAGVWAYYGNWLTRSMSRAGTGTTTSEVPDAPRRSGMRRLYSYILSAIGLGATFIGLRMVLAFVVDALLGGQAWGGTLRLSLTAALSTLGVGLPLWLLTWRPMQAEALLPGDAGDHARRSLLRKIYLYLALFVSVIGGMISAGSLVYLLLNALLGGGASNVLQGSLKALEILTLFVLLGVYHGLTLGKDGKTATRALTEKHAAFPTLIFDVENGIFGPAMLAAVQKQTPRLPAALQLVSQPVAKETTPKAVILPLTLALDPPESLRKWLVEFNGSRLVVPRAAAGWVWVGSTQADLNQAALAVRQLAEGQEVRQKAAVSGWTIFLYVIAGLFGLEAVGLLVSLGASLMFR
ncbi:MAG: DUF5671 domain-containing protein, partial [Chloroflexi bacterium]|nr:DUF5671 domain-containing protein [Chloroflexota bacterium]